MQKIVTNRCYGSFGLSTAATKRYLELCGITYRVEKQEFWRDHFWIPKVAADALFEESLFTEYNIKRDDPNLVRVVEELGKEAASSNYAALEITTIPDGVEWQIEEYDGQEWVAEKHQTW